MLRVAPRQGGGPVGSACVLSLTLQPADARTRSREKSMRTRTWRHTGTRAGTHLHLVLLLLEGEEAEDDGPDEHAQEADEQEVAHRVRVVIGKRHRGRVVLFLSSAAVTTCQTQARCMDVSGSVFFARTRRAVRLRELVQLRSAPQEMWLRIAKIRRRMRFCARAFGFGFGESDVLIDRGSDFSGNVLR